MQDNQDWTIKLMNELMAINSKIKTVRNRIDKDIKLLKELEKHRRDIEENTMSENFLK